MDDLRIALLGKTGMGKSATGNTILGREYFKVKGLTESVTQKCSTKDVTVDGQKVTVIDTPGLYDTSLKQGELKRRIEELFNYSGDGIHAFLLVFKLGTMFTAENKNAVEWFKDNFGEEASKNTIVLFTYGEHLTVNNITVEDYVNGGEQLTNLVDYCKGKYHVFNNKDNDRTQVTELLAKIREIISKDSLYTRKKYDETQKKLFWANIAGAGTGGAAGAGVAGGAFALAGAVKGAVITAAAVGGVGIAAVAGFAGFGVAVYKWIKRGPSPGKTDKKD